MASGAKHREVVDASLSYAGHKRLKVMCIEHLALLVSEFAGFADNESVVLPTVLIFSFFLQFWVVLDFSRATPDAFAFNRGDGDTRGV